MNLLMQKITLTKMLRKLIFPAEILLNEQQNWNGQDCHGLFIKRNNSQPPLYWLYLAFSLPLVEHIRRKKYVAMVHVAFSLD